MTSTRIGGKLVAAASAPDARAGRACRPANRARPAVAARVGERRERRRATESVTVTVVPSVARLPTLETTIRRSSRRAGHERGRVLLGQRQVGRGDDVRRPGSSGRRAAARRLCVTKRRGRGVDDLEARLDVADAHVEAERRRRHRRRACRRASRVAPVPSRKTTRFAPASNSARSSPAASVGEAARPRRQHPQRVRHVRRARRDRVGEDEVVGAVLARVAMRRPCSAARRRAGPARPDA